MKKLKSPKSKPLAIRKSPSQYQLDKQAIHRGKGIFEEVGERLARIHRTRSYREEYATFELFCFGEFGWNKSRAYQQINAAKLLATESTIVDHVVNEGQARALAKVPENMREEVVSRAKGKGELTAKTIESEYEKMTGRKKLERHEITATTAIYNGFAQFKILADKRTADFTDLDAQQQKAVAEIVIQLRGWATALALRIDADAVVAKAGGVVDGLSRETLEAIAKEGE